MPVRFTRRELDLMAVLWQHGPCTVAEVKAQLEDELAYTTVLTILRTLETKGHVGHEPVGKAHRYFARVAQEQAGDSAVRHIIAKVFRGSPAMLLAQLVRDPSLTAADMRRLRKVLKKRLAELDDE